MSYEYLSEDEGSYKLKHPEGHEVVIAKQAISDALHAKIKGMAPLKMKDGGEVPSMLDPQAVDTPDLVTEAMNAPRAGVGAPDVPAIPMGFRQNIQQTPVQSPVDLSASNGMPPNSVMAPVMQSQGPVRVGGENLPPTTNDPGNTQVPSQSGGSALGFDPKSDYYQAFMKSAQDQKKAVDMSSKALSQEGVEKLVAGQDYARHLGEQKIADQNMKADRDLHINKLFDEINNQKIDPKRLWNDSNGYQKASSIIGLILGGVGAGLTKGPNLALQTLDKMIDRDIEGQKMELGKKHTLYSMYMQKYNDDRLASLAAKQDMGTAFNAELQQASGKSQSQTAVSNGIGAKAQIDNFMAQKGMEMQNTAMARKIMAGGGLQQNGKPIDTNSQWQVANMVLPKEDRERLVALPGPQGTQVLRAVGSKEDADHVKKSNEEFGKINAAISDAKKFMENGMTLPMSDRDQMAKALNSRILGSMNQLAGISRFTKEEMEHVFAPMVPDIGAFRQGRAEKMLDQLSAEIKANQNSMYKQYVPGYGGINFTPKK